MFIHKIRRFIQHLEIRIVVSLVSFTFAASNQTKCEMMKILKWTFIGMMLLGACAGGFAFWVLYGSKSQIYGHAIMVVDVAVSKSGKKAFLLAEGNTPARNKSLRCSSVNSVKWSLSPVFRPPHALQKALPYIQEAHWAPDILPHATRFSECPHHRFRSPD